MPSRSLFPHGLLLLLVPYLSPSLGSAADPTYWKDVRPLLRKHCTVCHKESKLADREVSAGLAVDTLDAIRKGGVVPVLVPGKPDQSLLITLLTEKKLSRRMPLDTDPLDPAEIALLRKWVEQGAPEGTRPKDIAEPGTTTRPRKFLPVTFATKATLPKDWVEPGTLNLQVPIGPLAPVAALALTSDASKLAVGTYGLVTIWNLKTGQPEQMLTNVLGAVNDLKFSADNQYLAVSGGQPSARGDLRIYKTADWSLQMSLGGHLDVVSSVSFHPSGERLASASFDKTVRVWNLKTRQVEQTFTGHSDFVYSVAFSPKGDWFATASKDRTARIIDTATGKSKLTFSGMDQDVLALAIRPDGEQVVTSGLEPQLNWWDVATGQRVRRQVGHDVGVNELAFASKGLWAVSAGSDKTARLWNPQTGAAVRTLAVGSIVFSVVLDSEGKRVVVGCADGMVRLYDTATGRHLATLWSGQTPSTTANPELGWLVQTPEGFTLASEGVFAQSAWLTGTKPVKSAAAILSGVRQVDRIRAALAGDKVAEPVFRK